MNKRRLAAAVIGGAAIGGAIALRRAPAVPADEAIRDFDGPVRHFTTRSDDGTEIAIRVAGPESGSMHRPTVILAHGWTCSVANYPLQVGFLVDRGYRVVQYDQRGHGDSGHGPDYEYSTELLARDLRAVITAAVPADEKFLLAGHSMGGITIQALAELDPELLNARTAAILLISTLTVGPLTKWAGNPAAGALTAAATRLMALPVPLSSFRVTEQVLKLVTTSPAASPAVVRYTAELVERCAPTPRAAWLTVLLGTHVGAGLRGIAVPTSIIFGTQDRLTFPRANERIAAELKLAGHLDRRVAVRKAGHMVQLQAPETVNNLLAAILEDHLPLETR